MVKERGNADITLAFCRTHARRYFFEFYTATNSPIATQAFARIGALHAIKADIGGKPAATRKAVRQEKSRPLVEAMQTRLTDQLTRLSKGSSLVVAIRYTLHHWDGLFRFLDDGGLELDTNTVERETHRIPLGRKNAYFTSIDVGVEYWAKLIKVPTIRRIVGSLAEGLVATLIATTKPNDVERLPYLTDVLQRIVASQTKITEIKLPAPQELECSACPTIRRSCSHVALKKAAKSTRLWAASPRQSLACRRARLRQARSALASPVAFGQA